MKVYVVSAFCMNGSGGNKAGVVLDDFVFSANAKIALAANLGYSETVFLSDSSKADFKLEYFTPKGEVPLCGHATIASFIVLRDLGRLKKSEYTIETAASLLKVWIDGDGFIFMEQNSPSFFEIIPNERLTSCFHPLSLDGTYRFNGIKRYNYADFNIECIGNHGSGFQSNIYFEQRNEMYRYSLFRPHRI